MPSPKPDPGSIPAFDRAMRGLIRVRKSEVPPVNPQDGEAGEEDAGEEVSEEPPHRLEYETPARQGCDIHPMVNIVVNVVMWGGLALAILLILFFLTSLMAAAI